MSLPGLGSPPPRPDFTSGQWEPGRAQGQGHAARVVLGLEMEMGVPVSGPAVGDRPLADASSPGPGARTLTGMGSIPRPR